MGNYIRLGGATVTAPRKLFLEYQPIALFPEILSEGTACYRAKPLESNQWASVVKLTCGLFRHRPGKEGLKLAKKKNAWGCGLPQVLQICGKVSNAGSAEATTEGSLH